MKRFPLLSLLLVLICFSCEDEVYPEEQTGTVNLVFKAKYGEEYISLDKIFLHTIDISENVSQETPIKFQNLAFFASEISILNTDNSTPQVELEDEVKYIDFSSILHDETLASNGLRLTYQNVPVGTYEELIFGVGVPEEYNLEVPSNYAASHALSYPERYWTFWNSYIFSKIEGKMDSIPDAEILCDASFTYHIGMDEYYVNTKPISLDFEVVANEERTITITIDYQKILEKGKVVNIQEEFLTHSNPDNPSHVLITDKISENYITAFDIE